MDHFPSHGSGALLWTPTPERPGKGCHKWASYRAYQDEYPTTECERLYFRSGTLFFTAGNHLGHSRPTAANRLPVNLCNALFLYEFGVSLVKVQFFQKGHTSWGVVVFKTM